MICRILNSEAPRWFRHAVWHLFRKRVEFNGEWNIYRKREA